MDYDVWIFIWITKWRTDDRNKLPNVHENTTTQGFLVAINKGLQLVIMNLAARWWWFVEVWGPTLMLSTEDPALFLEVIRSPTCRLSALTKPNHTNPTCLGLQQVVFCFARLKTQTHILKPACTRSHTLSTKHSHSEPNRILAPNPGLLHAWRRREHKHEDHVKLWNVENHQRNGALGF